MLYAFMETKEVMKVNGYEKEYSIFSVPKSPNTGFIHVFSYVYARSGTRYILVWEGVARPVIP